MKKIRFTLLLSIISAITFLSSCSTLPEHASYIPTDAAMVGVIDIVSIGQKGKIQEAKSMHMYKSALELMQNSDENTATLFETLVEDPEKTGLDIYTDMFMYIYPIRQNDKGFFCINLKVDSKDAFKDNLEELLSDDYDLIEEEGYTYYSNERDSWIAFNDESAVFISALNAKNEDAAEFIQKIFSLDKTETISKNNEFISFYKDKKDVSFWISSTQFLQSFSPSVTEDIKKTLEDYDGLSIDDIENNYLHIFINFDEDNITCDFNLIPNDAFKKYLETTNFSKDKMNEELYQYFPQKSYFLAMYGFEPQKVYDYAKGFKNYKSFEKEMLEKDIKPAEILDALGGDIMFSIFDVTVDSKEEATKMLRLTPNGTYEYVDTVFVNESIIPRGSLVLSIKNEAVIQNLFAKIISPEMYKKVKSYMDFTETVGFPLFVGLYSNALMITSDNEAITQFYDGGYGENFTTSELSQEIDGSAFYYLNLDFETYPLQIKDYIKKIGVQSFIEPYTKAFESIVVSTTDDYSGQIIITMKDDKENSLYQVFQLIDSNFKNE